MNLFSEKQIEVQNLDYRVDHGALLDCLQRLEEAGCQQLSAQEVSRAYFKFIGVPDSPSLASEIRFLFKNSGKQRLKCKDLVRMVLERLTGPTGLGLCLRSKLVYMQSTIKETQFPRPAIDIDNPVFYSELAEDELRVDVRAVMQKVKCRHEYQKIRFSEHHRQILGLITSQKHLMIVDKACEVVGLFKPQVAGESAPFIVDFDFIVNQQKIGLLLKNNFLSIVDHKFEHRVVSKTFFLARQWKKGNCNKLWYLNAAKLFLVYDQIGLSIIDHQAERLVVSRQLPRLALAIQIPNFSKLAASWQCDKKGLISVLSLATLKIEVSFQVDKLYANILLYSLNYSAIIFSNFSESVSLLEYNYRNKELDLRQVVKAADSTIACLSLLPGSSVLAVLTLRNTLRLVNFKTGACYQKISLSTFSPIRNALFVKEWDSLVVAGDRLIRIPIEKGRDQQSSDKVKYFGIYFDHFYVCTQTLLNRYNLRTGKLVSSYQLADIDNPIRRSWFPEEAVAYVVLRNGKSFRVKTDCFEVAALAVPITDRVAVVEGNQHLYLLCDQSRIYLKEVGSHKVLSSFNCQDRTNLSIKAVSGEGYFCCKSSKPNCLSLHQASGCWPFGDIRLKGHVLEVVASRHLLIAYDKCVEQYKFKIEHHSKIELCRVVYTGESITALHLSKGMNLMVAANCTLSQYCGISSEIERSLVPFKNWPIDMLTSCQTDRRFLVVVAARMYFKIYHQGIQLCHTRIDLPLPMVWHLFPQDKDHSLPSVSANPKSILNYFDISQIMGEARRFRSTSKITSQLKKQLTQPNAEAEINKPKFMQSQYQYQFKQFISNIVRPKPVESVGPFDIEQMFPQKQSQLERLTQPKHDSAHKIKNQTSSSLSKAKSLSKMPLAPDQRHSDTSYFFRSREPFSTKKESLKVVLFRLKQQLLESKLKAKPKIGEFRNKMVSFKG